MSAVDALLPRTALPLRSREFRRENGIYYSPEDVARALVDWAVRASDDTLFDPSFGGCVFLRAGLARLEQLGTTDAPRRVFGTDLDSEAWGDADELVRLGANPRQFRRDDFLTLCPEDLDGPFRAVVGNPPYIRAHNLSDDAFRAARASLPDSVRLPGLASYWAYFVLHSLAFVAPGGRMALILPSTFLRADYAEVVRAELLRAFASVTILLLNECLFPDAEEESVLVLAEQRGSGPGTVRIGTARRDGLVIADAMRGETRPLTAGEANGNWGRGLFDADILALHDVLASRLGQLGSVARVRIGVVTGANDYFLVGADVRQKMGIEDVALHPVVARTAQLRGLWLTPGDVSSGSKHLFVPPTTDLPPGSARYVQYGEEIGIHRGFKCAKRTPWFVPLDTQCPDAFLSCMIWVGPRLALNCSGAVCTNTLLGVRFRPELDEARRIACAVGVLSTVSQLSAEIEGRVCGGGLLKIEPSDARRLIIPQVRLDGGERANLDALCRAGRWDEARAFVDARLVGKALARDELRVLTAALGRARSRRWDRRVARPTGSGREDRP